MKIAFWNLHNNISLGQTLFDMAVEYGVDILILAEYKERTKEKHGVTQDVCLDFLLKSQELMSPFNDIHYKVGPYMIGSQSNDRLKILSTYKESQFNKTNGHLLRSSRWTAFYITLPKININLFPLHFQSKNEWSDISQAMECTNLANDINEFEHKTSCSNSILIGDLNMNPFEPGINAAIGLNARQNKIPIQKNKTQREVDIRTYKHFYNPMWNLFGDVDGPPGTYYNSRSEQVSFGWNIFDQVMVRDGLRPYLGDHPVRIVTTVGHRSLLTKNGIPDAQNFSDHLPILLTLNDL